MTTNKVQDRIWLWALALAVPALSGCKPEAPPAVDADALPHTGTTKAGPDASAIEPTLDQGWCGGHGVPESVCTRCNRSLIPKFKAAGDWCVGHGLPESQCIVCNPEAEAAWAQLNPARAVAAAGDSENNEAENPSAGAEPQTGAGPASSAIEPTLDQGWCGGHGVPESVCTRCNPSLIPTFKAAGDWCAGHNLPESQCLLCNPEAEAAWEALNPNRPSGNKGASAAPSRKSPEGMAGLTLERVPRLVTGANNPLCTVDSLRVRFIEPGILEKAGIETAPARQRQITATIEVPAEVVFDATRVTRITPRIPGVVREVNVNVGDSVATGDVLAVVDSPELGEAKSRYIARLGDFAVARADQRRVQTIYEGVQRMLEACSAEPDAPGPARIAEALAGVPVGEAKARLLRAHASLLLARSEAARQERLFERKIGSERDLETARSALAAAEAEYLATREEIAFNAERERLGAERALQAARGALDAAERSLHILGLSEAEVDAVGSDSDEQLSRYALRSPVDGRVITRNVAAGESVTAADVLFVIADTSTLWLMADVYAADAVPLRTGAPVMLTVDGLPGLSFEGKLNWISSQVDDRTRTVRVRAELPNPDGLLRANMFGQARIAVHDNEDVLTVPADAVQTDGCCQLVFVRQSDTVFAPRKVVLGSSANGFVEVLNGLAEGDMVASAGSFLMKTEILKSNIGAGCCEVDPGR